MKLIVGLGNIGRKYENTRHNVGFDVLDLVAVRNAGGSTKDQFEGRTQDVTIGGERALLLWPHTLMNLSGRSVLAAAAFYQIPLSDLLVVCDDFNLPLGQLRIRSGGSDGGQNGLADVIRTMGTQEFARLRIGIGPVPERWNPADFVLGKFTAEERTEIDLQVARAADAVRMWTADGVTPTANKYNVKAT